MSTLSKRRLWGYWSGGGAPSYVASITPPGGTIYTGVNSTFTASTDVPSPTYTWSVGSGVTIVSGQGTASLVVTFTAAGSRTINLTVGGGGSASASWTGTVTAWVPSVIASLALWLDASDAASITLDGSNNAEQWNDKSGNSRHVYQASSLLRPNRLATHQNGLNVLDFNGSSHYMKTASSFTLADPATVYVVARSDSTATGQNVFDGFDAASNRWAIGSQTGGKAFVFQSGDAIRLTTEASTAGTVPRVMAMRFVDAEAVIRVNAVEKALEAGIGTVVNFNGANIGRWEGGAGYMNGWIGEILMYSGAHDAPTIAAVESYLMTKWGIS